MNWNIWPVESLRASHVKGGSALAMHRAPSDHSRARRPKESPCSLRNWYETKKSHFSNDELRKCTKYTKSHK